MQYCLWAIPVEKKWGGETIQFGRGGSDIFCGKGVISWSIFYFGHGILTMRKGYFNLGVSSRCDLFQFGGERGGGKKKKKKKKKVSTCYEQTYFCGIALTHYNVFIFV